MVSECLQWVRKPAKEVSKNTVAVVLTDKKKVIVHAQQNTSMITFMFIFLPYCTLHIFETGKRVNHESDYRIKILVNFHFYGPKKAIKLNNKESNKDQGKLQQNYKKLSKIKCIQTSQKKCLTGPVLGRVCQRI